MATNKKPVKSPIQVTAEQEALLRLNDIVKTLNQNIKNMQAWMKVTGDMILGLARLSGLDAKAFATAIDASERNKEFEMETVAELKKIRAAAEKKLSKTVPKRSVDAPVISKSEAKRVAELKKSGVKSKKTK